MSLAIWIGAVAVAVAAAALFIWRARRRHAVLPDGLDDRRQKLRRRMAKILTQTPERTPLASTEMPDHPQAAIIEAKLLSGQIRGALLDAEDILLEAPRDPRVHVLFARTLLHCGEFGAAARELARARRLGGSGPMVDYLEARMLHVDLHRRLTSPPNERLRSSSSELVSPLETFVLELDRKRARPRQALAVWSSVMTEGSAPQRVQKADMIAFMVDHFSAYYDCLDKLMLAVEGEPGFTDALYHLARMALKVGFTDEGLALMEKIRPLMHASTEKRFYDRDLSRLSTSAAPAMSAVLSARRGAHVSENRSTTGAID